LKKVQFHKIISKTCKHGDFPICAKFPLNSKLEEFYGSVVRLTIVSVVAVSLVSLGVLFLGKGYISADLYPLMRIGMLIFIVTACFNVLLHILRAKRQVTWHTVFSVWRIVVALGFGIALVMIFHYGVEGLLWGSILSTSVVLPLLWRVAVQRFHHQKRGISIPLTLEMAKYGFPLAVANLAAWVLSLSDRYIIELFRGSHEVGIYSVSYDISEKSIVLITSLFMLASSPILMNIWEEKGEEASRVFMNKLTRFYLILSIPAVVWLSVLARPIISVLTVQEYYEGYRIIPLVTLGAFFLGLQWIFQFGLRYYKKTHLTMFSIIASGLLNLGLNFFLVRGYGYIIAAVTTLISYVFLLSLIVITSRLYFVWEFPFKSLGKVICASAITGVIVYYIGNIPEFSTPARLILVTMPSIVVYFALLFLLRELCTNEIRALPALKNKIVSNAERGEN